MTQHIENFLQDCTTVTGDGSHATLDEVEGLYVYWCSLRADDALDTDVLLEALQSRGVEPVQRDGVDYVEGLVLTGPIMAGFILSCDFAGAWGRPELDSVAVRDVASVS
ncbi:hypothetical protein [Arthrobacter sp. NPDC092385]|uniref:hypothetical protein n=1 Tax=Arthrobacter sp. NPDC092385 TaxID=3363943 RepID=UPI003824610D